MKKLLLGNTIINNNNIIIIIIIIIIISNLFWSVTGQLKSIKEELEKHKLHNTELETKIEEVKKLGYQSDDRNLMVLEDTIAKSQRMSASSSLSEKEIYTLRQEIENLNAVISAKEDSYTVLGILNIMNIIIIITIIIINIRL